MSDDTGADTAHEAPHDLAHDLTQEAAVHLRAAALELITAARAVLDLTEQLVKDPGPLMAVVASLAASTARVVPPPVRSAPAAGDDEVTDGTRPRSRVQHIRVL